MSGDTITVCANRANGDLVSHLQHQLDWASREVSSLAEIAQQERSARQAAEAGLARADAALNAASSELKIAYAGKFAAESKVKTARPALRDIAQNSSDNHARHVAGAALRQIGLT